MAFPYTQRDVRLQSMFIFQLPKKTNRTKPPTAITITTTTTTSTSTTSRKKNYWFDKSIGHRRYSISHHNLWECRNDRRGKVKQPPTRNVCTPVLYIYIYQQINHTYDILILHTCSHTHIRKRPTVIYFTHAPNTTPQLTLSFHATLSYAHTRARSPSFTDSHTHSLYPSRQQLTAYISWAHRCSR